MAITPKSRVAWPNSVAPPTMRGQQRFDQCLWWPTDGGYTETVCGRCQATTHQWFVYFAWGPSGQEDQPTSLPTPDDGGVKYPRKDLAFPFQYVMTTREHPLQNVATLYPFGYSFEAPFRYLTSHWWSKSYGQTTGLSSAQLFWVLYYGDISMMVQGAPLTPPDQTSAITIANLYDWDSVGANTDGTFDSPPQCSGWVLALYYQVFFIPSQDVTTYTDPFFGVSFAVSETGDPGYYGRPLLTYALDVQDMDNPPTNPPYTVFRGQEANRFNIVNNPVNWPNHYAVVSPVCASKVRSMPPNQPSSN